VDANQLENAVLNLAVNARDAMPEGGKLTLETANILLDELYTASEADVSPGQYVLICVTDTGTGMTQDVAAKAIDPFFTTKAGGRGTGLGLSQVYGFVKQSGGHFKIYTEAGHGTTVKLYLPRFLGKPEAVFQQAAQPQPEQAAPLMSGKVLIVEDDEKVRRYTELAVEEMGYTVVSANGATEALRLLQENPDIILLFTDIVMPGMNGKKLAEQAERLRPDLKIIFTTGYSRNAVVHNGVVDAGVDLINKPFTIEQLAAKFRQVLRRAEGD
jgi:CheY-like chemotaxis protein